MLSYSRASLINLAVALVALVWLHRDRIRWRRLFAGAAIFGAGATALLSVAFPVFTGVYWQRVFVAFEYFWEAPNQVMSGRLESWRMLGNFIAAEPWHLLLGIGYKTLPYSDFIGTKAIGDNTYLSLLVETGILGLVAVVALNIAILLAARRASRSTDRTAIVLRHLDVLLLGRTSGADVFSRSADLLARAAGVLVRAGARRRSSAARMNVLFLDQFSELGGAQRCLLDLLPEILERGWSATAALPGAGPLVGLLRDWQVPVQQIPCGPYESGSKSFTDSCTISPRFAKPGELPAPADI